jgi:hypothetical protein
MPAAGRQTRRRTGTHPQGLALPLAFCSQADMTESSAPVMDKPGSGDSSAEIAEHMAAAIVARQLPPGTRLREEALCRLYGVSRTKIRAALLILSKDKLIRMVPDKGAFVSQPRKRKRATSSRRGASSRRPWRAPSSRGPCRPTTACWNDI